MPISKDFEIKRIKRNKHYHGFKDLLNLLGFKTYKEYLNSHYWEEAKQRCRESSLPKKCIVCGEKKYELHHRSYARLGAELPEDLVPLCRKHHKIVHDYIKKHNKKLLDIHVIIRELFGWSRKESIKRFRAFNNGRGYSHLTKKNMKKVAELRRRDLERRRKENKDFGLT